MTEVELQIIRLARFGWPSATIALELGVGRKTVVRVLESMRGYLHHSPLSPQQKGADERQRHRALQRGMSSKGGPR